MSEIQECGSVADVHVCLICGYVGCGGRAARSHMSSHHNSTLHAYALDIETQQVSDITVCLSVVNASAADLTCLLVCQQVWDFAGGGYVHRLLHNKADGKLVEIGDPRHASSSSGERPQVEFHQISARSTLVPCTSDGLVNVC